MFDSITEQIIKVTKDGRYYIGDPCQVLSTVNWDRLVDIWFPSNYSEYTDNVTALDNFEVAFFEMDDGCHRGLIDNIEINFMIDSGVIALVPYDLMESSLITADMTILDLKNGDIFINDGNYTIYRQSFSLLKISCNQ